MKKITKIIFRIIEKILSSKYGRKQYQYFFEKIYSISLRGMNYGVSGDFYKTGEVECLKYVKTKLNMSNNIIIFDVGANIGDYSKKILECFSAQKIQLYSFEPSLAFEKLKTNIGNKKDVQIINSGLGEKSSTIKLFYDEPGSSLASLYKRRLYHFNINFDKYEEVKITTIDEFCSLNHIEQIDFLKLDVEGHELKVLEGGRNLLEKGKIKFIQFEFGGCNIDSRTYFWDFFYTLKSHYQLYRIVKNGLFPINQYQENYEIFKTINYLAEYK